MPNDDGQPARAGAGVGIRVGEHHLARQAEEALARLGDHPTLWFEGIWHSSGELAEQAARVGTGLRSLGVRPGDRVVVFMANCPQVSVAYTAIWRAGAVATPVIFLVTAPELRHVLVDSGAVAVMTTAEFISPVSAAAAGLAVSTVVVGDVGTTGTAEGSDPADRPTGPVVPYAELAAAEPGTITPRRDDDLAALLYTGGTTGRSKGVMITHANLSRGTAAVRQISHVPGVTRTLLPLPQSHAFGLMVTVAAVHATEPGTTVLMRWFDPARWVDLAAEHRVQSGALVPSMLMMLLDQPLEEHDLSALRYVRCGAAPLPPRVALEFERRVPSALVLEGYGCTETSAVLTASPHTARRLGTVGVAPPGVQVRVVDELGTPLGPGADGEIVVRGPNVTPGYWHDDDQTAAAFTPEGWLRTGDVGRMDADGYLTIVDRTKDLILRGGFNVFPRDVEEVLTTHPAVRAAAVVGRPDPRLGEEVVAFVSPRPGTSATPADLVAYAKARLSATKYPREVRVVDAIPLTAVGKTDRKRLRATLTTPLPHDLRE